VGVAGCGVDCRKACVAVCCRGLRTATRRRSRRTTLRRPPRIAIFGRAACSRFRVPGQRGIRCGVQAVTLLEGVRVRAPECLSSGTCAATLPPSPAVLWRARAHPCCSTSICDRRPRASARCRCPRACGSGWRPRTPANTARAAARLSPRAPRRTASCKLSTRGLSAHRGSTPHGQRRTWGSQCQLSPARAPPCCRQLA
jgi:hypothetical protein